MIRGDNISNNNKRIYQTVNGNAAGHMVNAGVPETVITAICESICKASEQINWLLWQAEKTYDKI